jgi:hypothetical protein
MAEPVPLRPPPVDPPDEDTWLAKHGRAPVTFADMKLWQNGFLDLIRDGQNRALAKRDQEIVELRNRLDELERNRVKFCRTFEWGVVYSEGSFVTHQGSLWYATAETRQAPGEGCTAWCLAVKRGSDAKAAQR